MLFGVFFVQVTTFSKKRMRDIMWKRRALWFDRSFARIHCLRAKTQSKTEGREIQK